MDSIDALFDVNCSDIVTVTRSTIADLQNRVDACLEDIDSFKTSGIFYHTLLSIQTRIRIHCTSLSIQYYTDDTLTITISGKHFLIDLEMNANGLCSGGQVAIGDANVLDPQLNAHVVGLVERGDLKLFCALLCDFSRIDKGKAKDKIRLFKALANNDVEMLNG